MVRLRKKIGAEAPEILATSGLEATRELIARFEQGEKEFKSGDFTSEIYGHTKVKEQLIQLQDDKCCFCESKISHISYGDVEHYRPKAGWIQENEKLNKPGYYWLAYDWENLLLSCQICNQRFKRNYFPLLPGAVRALSHRHDYRQETPVFIHPALDDPEAYIDFKDEIPVSRDAMRGMATIKGLGLDREALNEQRRKVLNMLRDIYFLATNCPDTAPDFKEEARKIIRRYKEESEHDHTEYASMKRAFFRNNPDT